MLPGLEMLACPDLAVSRDVLQHIVRVESSANPYAIGVVGGQLERQPKTLSEALATAKMLETQGYNFSVGLAQVNRANLSRFGLDSYEDAFDTCSNLSAGAQILADCYSSAGGDWGKAFSCYYSGNFTTGFRDGYVQKVFASINDHSAASEFARSLPSESPAIPVRIQPVPSRRIASNRSHVAQSPYQHVPVGSNYRVTLRTMAIDSAAAATVAAPAPAPSQTSPLNSSVSSTGDAIAPRETATDPAAPAEAHLHDESITNPLVAHRFDTTKANTPGDSVFVPAVRGPNDPPGTTGFDGQTSFKSRTKVVNADTEPVGAGEEPHDAAFVF